jgi:hypothetical protein
MRSALLLCLLVPLSAGAASGPAVAGPTLTIDAAADNHAISPDIYGSNFSGAGTRAFADPNNWTLAEGMAFAHEIGQTVDRWGGNTTDRYNWKIGAWNTGSDYYFENIAECAECGYRRFVEDDRAIGARSLITLPLAGWVAKSASPDHPFLCSFPKTQFPTQDSFDPYDPNCGNGRSGSTQYTADPAVANVAEDPRMDPDFYSGWVTDLVSRYGAAANGGVLFYELGNEPGLWNSTHRDVHPQDTSYDELGQKSLAAAEAVKSADPSAKVIGFSEWGWPNYFCSQSDIDAVGYGPCNTTSPGGPDAQAHGGLPIVEWLLRRFRGVSQSKGKRLLDYIDVHYYNQANPYDLRPNNPNAETSVTDTTRSLWDPTFKDPSWIDDTIQLIPRMKKWIADDYPGTKIALTEYNLSLENVGPLTNALIQADTLGIFAREGVDLATRWTQDVDGEWSNNHYTTLIPWAFRVYRNYDGQGSRFGDISVRSVSGDQRQLAVYAAKRADGSMTIVVINKTADGLESPLTVSGIMGLDSARVYRWSGDPAIVRLADQPISGNSFTTTYPARSITVFQLNPHVVTPPPPPPPARTLSVAGFSAVQKGRMFTASMQVRRDDTGELLTSAQVGCNGKVVGKARKPSSSAFSGTTARCSWSVAKRLRGKRITGSIAVTYSGVTATRSFSAKIK